MTIADLDIVTRIGNFFSVLFEWLPRLLGAAVILLIGYILARILAAIVRRLLRRADLDRRVEASPLGRVVARLERSPSTLLGAIVFWVVFFGSFAPAADALGIASVKRFVASVYAYIPDVLAALAILIIAGLLAGTVGRLIRQLLPPGPITSIAASAAPALVMVIATFMALDQLKIAETIVTITYAALIGSIALGAALAFGLGGREAASQALARATQPGSRPGQTSDAPRP